MQSDSVQQLSQKTWIELVDDTPTQSQPDASPSVVESAETDHTHFRSQFTGAMELNADTETVRNYLNAHHGWFCRCAHPMAVAPVGDNGYVLTVGRYGSFGFQVEPKIALHLLPPDDQGVYRIETIPGVVLEEKTYHVDFQADLCLVDHTEVDHTESEGKSNAASTNPSTTNLSTTNPSTTNPSTHVEWTLDLAVSLLFPSFIRRLPHALIQATGDRLLMQIVRQISRRLTAKVQADFHNSLDPNQKPSRSEKA